MLMSFKQLRTNNVSKKKHHVIVSGKLTAKGNTLRFASIRVVVATLKSLKSCSKWVSFSGFCKKISSDEINLNQALLYIHQFCSFATGKKNVITVQVL